MNAAIANMLFSVHALLLAVIIEHCFHSPDTMKVASARKWSVKSSFMLARRTHQTAIKSNSSRRSGEIRSSDHARPPSVLCDYVVMRGRWPWSVWSVWAVPLSGVSCNGEANGHNERQRPLQTAWLSNYHSLTMIAAVTQVNTTY